MTVTQTPPRHARRVLVGRPMATREIEETLLPKTLALPIFASDPLSSVAYATEEGMIVLVGGSAAALHLVFPLSLAIAALLAVVVVSYMQTVRAYETSGGAYIVARENLGTLPSLVGGAALLTDYVLTVAVSVAAGTFAIASFVPTVGRHEVVLSLAAVGFIAIANLRGVRETGFLFAMPTYAFVTAMGVLVISGLVELGTGHAHRAVVPHPLAAGSGAVTLFVLLRAFSSGSTALTGVEAIANGVNAFRNPQGRNAARTLAILGVIAITLFTGVSYLAVHLHARPSSTASVVSQIARAVFPAGTAGAFMYYAVQILTLTILVLAANTSFQGFPRLGALLARDRFFPRQFLNLGDRLVFSNGILVLTSVSALLLWIYSANVNSLIHLYVIGVFTAFTLSQAGMVRYWRRTHAAGWQWRAVVNAVGAAATGVVTLIVIWTKFAEGAWLVTVAIPVIVLLMYGIRRHYAGVGRRLQAGTTAVASAPVARNRTLLVVQSLDAATERALRFVQAISDGDFRAVHVARAGTDPGIRARWFRASGGVALLEPLTSDGSPLDAVLEEVWRYPRGESDFVTIVIPEFFRKRSLLEQARRPFELLLKLRLLNEAGVVVADVPTVGTSTRAEKPLIARVFASGVNAASMRAVNWVRTLDIADTRAVHFAFDADDAERVRRDWAESGPRVPLDVDEAPYRDIGEPVLRYLRELSAEHDVLAVLPELVFRGWRRMLHNQRALYIKRLLLLEEGVMLASVPYQLLR